MVTGQSVVLYSRLGVVLGPFHDNILRAVRWMIIVDAIVFHISTSVVFFGTFETTNNEGFAQAYKYIEKIQMTGRYKWSPHRLPCLLPRRQGHTLANIGGLGFTLQEFILSGLYVWRTIDILKTSPDWSQRRKRIMQELWASTSLS